MAIPRKQIGWSNESNLIWEISRQLEQLIGVAYAAGNVPNNSRPYKVYTALLSQTGGDDIQNIFSAPLTIGVTYTISAYAEGDDFSNVGGPSSGTAGQWNGFSFVATGTTPTLWSGSTLEYNTGAPVVTSIFENTLGVDLTWTYDSIGEYFAKLPSGTFDPAKTFISITNSYFSEPYTIYGAVETTDNSYVVIGSYDDAGNSAEVNGDAFIEIRVYN